MVTLVIPIKVILESIVAPSFVVSNKLETLEILFTTIPLTPPQIGVGLDIILISNTPHALEVFIMPITSFEKTPNQHKIATKIGIQVLSQVELVEEANAIPTKGIINQQVVGKTCNWQNW
jgi:hypothetical protein